ncbi:MULTISPECIES: hypothetical protein [Streptomyces]|uniref:Uncharacterized protein n=1 Tax=Streptomyces decoyicus TaxID=249567 RepID=A0ABZ1FIS3_9ACTN|nr:MULTISPECIES: hypothetical protein [Streptomyces]KOG43508.1 hypothetical protein ADK74_15225 [Streptomyces decoyicus]QZY17596.1 hypothetical protein K7C20_22040 [Streptomyces decoyicus]WSB69578.1 hypothetical protein OG863_17385 [Streptomyces decoyicus]BDH15664.1 hypothetical protein HOK021_68430 [Streptomyces hygroscopicus]
MLTARDRVRQAEVVMVELQTALRAVGVTLPSLCVDPVSCASSVMAPLVELGRCNLDTAQRLADVLAEYAKTAAPGHGTEERQP